MGTTVETCLCCESPDIESSQAIWMPFVSHRAMGLPPLKIDSSTGLTNIPDGTAYSLCKSLMCRECGLLFADYRFSDAEVERLYRDYRGEEYTNLRNFYEPGYMERNKILTNGNSYLSEVEGFLRDLLPGAGMKVLDWGGDTGINSPFTGERSLLHIFDPSAKTARLADAVSFSEVPLEAVNYDLIVLSNVLEHVPFPAETLNAIIPLMTSTTVLYIEVPLELLQLGAHYPPYSGASKKKHWHEHINFFTTRSMEILINNCGLQVVSHNLLNIVSTWHEMNNIPVPPLLQYACVRRVT